MLRRDKLLIQAHPDFLATEEETLQLIQRCQSKGINILACAFGTVPGVTDASGQLRFTGGDDIKSTTSHPLYPLMFSTATRMLWQAKEETGKNYRIEDLLDRGEWWVRECLRLREQYRLNDALFNTAFAEKQVSGFREHVGYAFLNAAARPRPYATLWTRFGYADFAQLNTKMANEDMVRTWLRIWEYGAAVQMRKLSERHNQIVDRIIIVLDLANVGLSAVSWLRSFMKPITSATRHLFPEMIAHVLFLNMPWMLRAPTNALAKLLLNPATIHKFRFLANNDGLLEFFDKKDIPVYLGGENESPEATPCPVTGRLVGGDEKVWTEELLAGKVSEDVYLRSRDPYDPTAGLRPVSAATTAATSAASSPTAAASATISTSSGIPPRVEVSDASVAQSEEVQEQTIANAKTEIVVAKTDVNESTAPVLFEDKNISTKQDTSSKTTSLPVSSGRNNRIREASRETPSACEFQSADSDEEEKTNNRGRTRRLKVGGVADTAVQAAHEPRSSAPEQRNRGTSDGNDKANMSAASGQPSNRAAGSSNSKTGTTTTAATTSSTTSSNRERSNSTSSSTMILLNSVVTTPAVAPGGASRKSAPVVPNMNTWIAQVSNRFAAVRANTRSMHSNLKQQLVGTRTSMTGRTSSSGNAGDALAGSSRASKANHRFSFAFVRSCVIRGRDQSPLMDTSARAGLTRL
ncbi:unnamed protein product [Amoebophrya sp. A25]|nr:unnamed protein product [Amoebophrya sp. A25]|eukprot:GSA25T00002528001.1